MRIVTNVKLVQRNKRITQYLFFFSLAVLMLGFVVINAQLLFPDLDPALLGLTSFVLPLVVLPVAFLATVMSIRMTNLWVRRPRPEEALADNLKGLGNKAALYSYFHFPARHVLIAPQGVFAIVTRFQDGTYEVEGNEWATRRSFFGRILSMFRMDGIGAPIEDAKVAAAHVEKQLADIAPDVKVQPIVLFTDPRAKLTITKPEIPVLRAQSRVPPSMQDYLKGIPKQLRQPLTEDQIFDFERKTLPDWLFKDE